MSASKIRVMIAHPIPLLSAGLDAAIRSGADFEIVAANFTQPQTESASTVVTDCETGLQLTRFENANRSRILIVTHDESEASIRRALDAGIRGYLLITSPLESIVRAIRSIHQGGTALDPIVAGKMVDSFAGASLTRRETDVLRLLMLGLRDKAIASRLTLSAGTVKTHLKAVRAKLNASSRTEAIAIAQRRGLVPEGGISCETPPPPRARNSVKLMPGDLRPRLRNSTINPVREFAPKPAGLPGR